MISTKEYSENTFSFTQDRQSLFVTRTIGWQYQSGLVFQRQAGNFVLSESPAILDSIYNGAISPSGNQIIFSIRSDQKEEIFLTLRKDGSWSDPTNLSMHSGIYGGYFFWVNENELYLYSPEENGNLIGASLTEGRLSISNHLKELNTVHGTEFSPYLDDEKQFIIFTRYLEGDTTQQGFFVSFWIDTALQKVWTEPQKIQILPYGWNALVNKKDQLFLYTNGEDIEAIPLGRFFQELDSIKEGLGLEK
ncbi:MAG: hypothetical protein AAF616_14475 [Bacteroidota bacterium]